MKILVGDTGFVGSNILSKGTFDKTFNSENISSSYDLNPDILYYSGVKAEKFLANKFPEEDFKHIEDTINNITRINPKKIILISSVDVYDKLENLDEDYFSNLDNLQPYGKNRLYLENWVRDNFKDSHIVRLSALFGKNIKKNFIYDILNPIPKKIAKDKMEFLTSQDQQISTYYVVDNLGFYNLDLDSSAKRDDEIKLLSILENLNFTALNFTDSRNVYQFYNLSNLYSDIDLIINNDLRTVNLVTEGISASEIYNFVFSKEFKNEFLNSPVKYNLKTKYYNIFGGSDGYINGKSLVLNEIKSFIELSK